MNNPSGIISWQDAALILENDGVIALPTDTVYGLAAKATSKKACDRIYELKGRDFSKPLVIMSSNVANVRSLIDVWDNDIQKLTERYWPGALTVVFKAISGEPILSAIRGQNTIGIRIPAQVDLLKLLNKLNFPLAVTSANRSGLKDCRTVAEVIEVFSQELDGIITDDKLVAGGIPSTVVDVTISPWKILRTGPITDIEVQKWKK